jgi:hypothetical protein
MVIAARLVHRKTMLPKPLAAIDRSRHPCATSHEPRATSHEALHHGRTSQTLD